MYKQMFLLFLLFSCNNTVNSRLSNENQNVVNIDYYTGVWIRKDYIDNLRKNLSPKDSFIYLDGISSLIIESGDKINNVILNHLNTETSQASLNKKNNTLDLFWNGKLISCSVFSNEEEMSLDIDNKKLVFVRVRNIYVDHYGIKDVVNQVLFSNKKFDCYSKESLVAKNIVFNISGKISNFLDYKNYEVQNTFVVDENPVDRIKFIKSNGKTDYFHFRFKDNKLDIFNIRIIKDTLHSEDDEDYQDIEQFDLLYTLKTPDGPRSSDHK